LHRTGSHRVHGIARRAGRVHGDRLYADALLSGEACTAHETAGAFAAYITGNVASNLFGRLLSARSPSTGLAGNFYVFAALNLAGAALVYFYLKGTSAMPILGVAGRSPLAVWREHLKSAPLRASFIIGFCILFAFIGTLPT
jgi:hypothetical protein